MLGYVVLTRAITRPRVTRGRPPVRGGASSREGGDGGRADRPSPRL